MPKQHVHNHKFHLEIQTHRKNPYGLLRSTYWNPVKKMPVHETLCRINHMSLEQLKNIQAAIQKKSVAMNTITVLDSREYGCSAALLSLTKEIALDKAIYSKTSEPWVKDVLAMIIGRIIYQGSKLSLSNCAEFSALWEICGITDEEIDVDNHCYKSLDELLKRQNLIQKKLALKHIHNGMVILYDITSSYLEGEYKNSELVAFGYNRDKKKEHPQIVIGLICAEDGCPISVEVFKGNTKDEKTVPDKISEIKNRYGIVDAIFVGDRGMLTAANLEKCPFKTITALRRDGIKHLCEEKQVQLSLFDEKIVNEIELPDEPGIRYALCRNPLRAERENKTRIALIEKTEEKLRAIEVPKRKVTEGTLGVRVGKVINKYKVGHYFHVKITGSRVCWERNQSVIDRDETYDGLYVIRSDVGKTSMTAEQLVKTYRKMSQVEQAFRILKSVQLEIRPLYHHKDDRIRAHVFMCMLAYHILWHMDQRLKVLYDSEAKGKSRKYSIDFVLESLKAIRKEKISIGSVEGYTITKPNSTQQKILDLLGVHLK
jgi:transposase